MWKLFTRSFLNVFREISEHNLHFIASSTSRYHYMHLKRHDESVTSSLDITALSFFYFEEAKLMCKRFVLFGRLFKTFSLKLNKISFPHILFAKEYYILLVLEWVHVKEENFTPLLEWIILKALFYLLHFFHLWIIEGSIVAILVAIIFSNI